MSTYQRVSGNLVIQTVNSSDSITLSTAAISTTGNCVVDGSFLRVPVFAGNSARDSAIVSPAAGMIILSGTNFQGYTGAAWANLN
jgi:hypothetical protein